MSAVLQAELECCPACGHYARQQPSSLVRRRVAITQVHDSFSVDLSDTCADLLVCSACGAEELVDAEAFELAQDQLSGYVGWSPTDGVVLHLQPTWLASSCALCA